MNPQQMFKNMIGNNPKQMVMNMLGVNNNNMITSLIEMAQKGDSKSIENFARNFCNERGTNFDTEFSKFMSNFK